MAMKTWRQIVVALIFSLFINGIAHAGTVPPTQTTHFYGDADGDLTISGLDIIQHKNFVATKEYSYDTLQPVGPSTDWNTCDVDSDRACSGLDLIILKNAVAGNTNIVTDDNWIISNPLVGGLPASVESSSSTPFRINVSSYTGTSGRPGVTVVATIVSGGGSLGGRECVPVPENGRDQSSAGATCAMAVTQTDWTASTTDGLTESGAFGFTFNAPSTSDTTDIHIVVNGNPALDMQTVSVTVTISSIEPDAVSLTCPTSADENSAFQCAITGSGPSSCSLGAATTCMGATITGCTTIEIPAQAEAGWPWRCVVQVEKGSASDKKKIKIIHQTTETDINDALDSIYNVSTSEDATIAIMKSMDLCGIGYPDDEIPNSLNITQAGLEIMAEALVNDETVIMSSLFTNLSDVISEYDDPLGTNTINALNVAISELYSPNDYSISGACYYILSTSQQQIPSIPETLNSSTELNSIQSTILTMLLATISRSADFSRSYSAATDNSSKVSLDGMEICPTDPMLQFSCRLSIAFVSLGTGLMTIGAVAIPAGGSGSILVLPGFVLYSTGFIIAKLSTRGLATNLPNSTVQVTGKAVAVFAPPVGNTGNPMILIPEGCFQMGNSFGIEEGNIDELPVHEVCLSEFYLNRHPVTVSEYKICVADGFCTLPLNITGCNQLHYYDAPDSAFDNYPVVWVDWNQATSYCNWVGGRLPTEAEFEKATRGGLSGKRYPNGDTITCADAHIIQDGSGNACPLYNPCELEVESYPPNGYGLYDMVGNVEQYMSDWYDQGYYAISPINNPQGPAFSDFGHVQRGGYLGYCFTMRSSSRYFIPIAPEWLLNNGFRCAKSP